MQKACLQKSVKNSYNLQKINKNNKTYVYYYDFKNYKTYVYYYDSKNYKTI